MFHVKLRPLRPQSDFLNLHYVRRSVEHFCTDLDDDRIYAFRLADEIRIPFDFFRRGGALHGDHLSARANEGEGPPGKLPERCDSPGGDDINEAGFLAHGLLFGATANDGEIFQTEILDDLVEERRTAKQGFDENDGNVRTRNG